MRNIDWIEKENVLYQTRLTHLMDYEYVMIFVAVGFCAISVMHIKHIANYISYWILCKSNCTITC